jgi:outer membrane protein OmpA-like peptidoglycan-associated protein
MTFCTNCGTRSPGSSAFCSGCGKPLVQAPAAHAVAAPKPTPWGKILAVVLVLVVLMVGSVIGGLVYVGYRVKQKVSEFTKTEDAASPKETPAPRAQPHNGDSRKSTTNNNNQNEQVSKALDGIGGLMDRMGLGDPPPNPYADLPVATSAEISKNLCASADTATELQPPAASEIGPSGIPMREGLMLIHSWGRKPGDSESINRVTKVTDKYVEIADTGTYFSSPDDVKGSPGADFRVVCAEDLQTARGVRTGFGDDGPRTSPGTTTISVSQAVFNDLKTRGKTDLRYLEWWKMQDMEKGEGYLHWEAGVLNRVEPGDVRFPVIVNGTPTTLPAIHASGTMVVDNKRAREMSRSDVDKPQHSELYVLDDPKNPLLLLYRMDVNNFRVQTTEIRFPLPQPVKKIEQDLLKNKRAIVYGIYFDFNQDTIKPESEPVLKEIAQAIVDRPDWKLMIAGYTDNIGGDKYNLDLSQRRSASVKRALVERYHVDGSRLSTAGYGDSSPIDTNDTLEGRARNRRVELTLD